MNQVEIFMDEPPQTINTQKVSFSNGNEAVIVTPNAGAPTSNIVHALSIPRPGAVILIAGGAAEIDDSISARLIPLFTEGVAELAASFNALVIDGGTQAGVMALMGKGVAAWRYQSTLLGIAPAQNVVYPGKVSTASEIIQLDPNHSHFVLVDSSEWGGETETMYALAQYFSRQIPSVAVLADGGKVAKSELLYNVRQRRPVIVIEGSGRLADEVARLWREKPTSFHDSEFAEILTQGNLHFFPLVGSHTEFTQLLQHQLDR